MCQDNGITAVIVPKGGWVQKTYIYIAYAYTL